MSAASATSTREMRIMDREAGDLKVVWDAGNDDEVAAARAQFDKLRGKGFLAYRVGRKGSKGEQLRQFDPDAESVILAPPLVGG